MNISKSENSINQIKRIEKLNDYIHSNLISYVIDDQYIYQEIFQRLYNASSTLYVNALRFYNNCPVTPELMGVDLTGDDIEEILRFLYCEITGAKFPKEIFNDFFLLLKSYNIYPYFLLKTNNEEIDIFFEKINNFYEFNSYKNDMVK
ncbi:MAG: hypothetical protein IKW39_05180 [Alphaproteobacteria bacterium]|nr:hypothetical protein [Alphaproteobacteria bacterium]